MAGLGQLWLLPPAVSAWGNWPRADDTRVCDTEGLTASRGSEGLGRRAGAAALEWALP